MLRCLAQSADQRGSTPLDTRHCRRLSSISAGQRPRVRVQVRLVLRNASARAADLSGLPPAFIDVGSAEVFRDEDIEYATRIWSAGGQAELHVWSGGFHGFEMVAHASVSRA